MNKLFYLVPLLLITNGQARETETLIELLVFNARGDQVSRDAVMISRGSIMVNSERLTAGETITQSPYIKKMATFKTSLSVSRCEEGTFQHILKKGTVEKKETGCFGSPRYKELKDAFNALKKDPTAN